MAGVVAGSTSLGRLARAYGDLGALLAASEQSEPLAAVTTACVAHLPAVDWASVTLVQPRGGFRTVGATDPQAAAADELQYRVGHGPCVDATAADTIYRTGDIAHDARWPEFGRLVAQRFGVDSMLAFRLSVDGGDLLGALNLYATAPAAFTDEDVTTGELFATHAAARVELAGSRRAVRQLSDALHSNREIGVAMGVLMGQHRITREQAFDLLRIASQNSNRKLRDIAVEVGDRGELSLVRP